MEDIKDLLNEEQAIQESDSWLKQKVFSEIEEEFYQRGSFSVYIIHAVANGKLWEGCGFSKTHSEVSAAHFDIEKGKSIARGRAVHDLFSEYKKSKLVKNEKH
jgi:hypothetical protein